MDSDEKTKDDRPSFGFDSDRNIPNLIFMFGVIAVIVQVYLGWNDFLDVWSYMSISDSVHAEQLGKFSSSQQYFAVKETAPLFLGWQIEIGFQIAVLVFIKHYSNTIKRLKASQAS